MTAPTPVEVDVRLLGPLKKIGSGGQGTVYELLDGPDTLVYKEYSARVVDDVDVAALRKFVTFARELDEPTQRRLTERAAWPVNLVRRDGVVRGFVMPRAPRDFMVELAWTTGRDTVLAQTQYLLNDRQYLRERGLTVTDRFRLEFLRDTVETIALFHRLGIVVGDLSPHNLLFSQAVRPRCFFIDCDAMRLGADSVLAAVETPDWRVEDLGDEELATRASDSYKLGLLALRIFAGDQHERDLGAVSALPARTRSVATSSLARSPAARPPVQKWLRPLDSALRQANRRPFRRRTDRPPRTASQTRQRRRWPWLAVAPVVIGIVLGI
ncbi:MAG TPA: hypothetical protein VH352_04825, partial [Pseudonocardiaceae bacterium]|nr:hypothetical protein [Pseudonocardiaceae bacterium]